MAWKAVEGAAEVGVQDRGEAKVEDEEDEVNQEVEAGLAGDGDEDEDGVPS